MMPDTKMTVTKDYLSDEYTGNEYTIPCDDVTAEIRRFDLFDDDNERYYRVVIQHCDETAAEAAFFYFMRDSGTTYMQDITGDGIDFSMS
jgi:hypothetical protein